MKRLLLPALALVLAAGLAVHAQMGPALLGVNGTDAFFDDSVVHDIRLDLNERDWQSLKANFRENTYYPADFRWRDQVVRNIGIRSRGQASRSGTKPALRLDFNRFTTGQTFLGLKSAVLKNNVTDASNMHERLSMALMRRMGVPASREAHARLFINGAYVGVYTLVESIDKDFLRRMFNENDGYLFEYEWAFPYYFTDRGTNPDPYVPSPFKPQTHEDDSRPEVLVELVQTVNHSPNFLSEIATYLDLKKFLRQIAVETFLADSDDFLGDLGMANFYLYRFENKKLFTFIAWDKSEAFTSPLFSIWQHIRGVDREHTNQLVARALESSDLYNSYLDTLLECVRSINEPGTTDPRGWMEREIDRIDAQIRDATFNDPVKPFANGQYDQALSGMREFAQRRGAFVTDEVNASR